MKKIQISFASRGFTVVEIMSALAVLLVLVSIATFCYLKFINSARESVCGSNLKGLQNAIHFYGVENHALPATLGELKLEHLQQGHDLAMKHAGWKTRFAHSFLELKVTREAHAFSLTYDDLKKYGAKETIFRCPADHNGGASYALNTEHAGRKLADISGTDILIAESDSHTFSDTSELQYRHGNRKKALAITMGGSIINLNRDSSDNDDDDDAQTICHNGKITMTKSGSSLEDHLAHGDTLGPCP